MNIQEGLIVSCQALKHEPLYGGDTIAKMAHAARLGGAVGIRANTTKDIRAISKKLKNSLPIIGLIKAEYPDSSVYITPTAKEVKRLVKSGCEVIALDATQRRRPGGEKLEDLITLIRKSSNKKIMADIATLEEAVIAEGLGVDYISSTLYGYTESTKGLSIPDLGFLTQLKAAITKATVVAEGGINSREILGNILQLGYRHIVIGGAITRPLEITKGYTSVVSQFVSNQC